MPMHKNKLKCVRCTILFNAPLLKEKPYKRGDKYYCKSCYDKGDYIKPKRTYTKYKKRHCGLCNLRLGTMRAHKLFDMEVCIKCFNK